MMDKFIFGNTFMKQVRNQLLLIGMLLIPFNLLFSFSSSELDNLRSNPDWLVGKGQATIETQADRMAINDLLSQISVQVQSSFESIVTEENGNVQDYCNSVIKTYSSARLDAAERSVFDTNGQYTVYRYIKRADKDRVFADREKMARDYAIRGLGAEKEMRIGDALLNYYWSLLLLRTHPDWSRISEYIDGRQENLITFLPDRIRRIFSLLTISAGNVCWDNEDRIALVEVSALYDGQPVRNLDFRYYFGNNWSHHIGVNEGVTLIEFLCEPAQIPNPIRINVNYTYEERAGVNGDIAKILGEMTPPAFPECRFEIRMDGKPKAEVIAPLVIAQSDSVDTTFFQDTAKELCTAIQAKETRAIDSLCTPEGKQCFSRIIQNGKGRLVQSSPNLFIDHVDGKTVVRGMMMQFTYPNSGRSFTEPVVFTFNADNKIEKISLGLSEKAVDDIIGNVTISPAEKQRIVGFIEDYKTAYTLKDLSFVEKVFADNALIIVGKMLKDDPTDLDGMYKKLGKNWRAVRYTKQEYLENLRNVFNSNEYVNLTFEDNVLRRTNDPSKSVFGVQIQQYYYSQHYADDGYLFLMFDLTEIEKPRIYVRTWQPEKNPDGSIYGLKDFFIN